MTRRWSSSPSATQEGGGTETARAPSQPRSSTKRHRKLRGEWLRHRLGDRHALLVFLLGIRFTALSDVTMHVAAEREGPTDAERSEAREVNGGPKPLLLPTS